VRTWRTPIRIRHNEDHATEAAITHPRNEGLREQKRLLHVDRLDLTPHFKLELVKRPEGDHRRRVDKNVAPTVAIEYRIRGPAYLNRVTQINHDVAPAVQDDNGMVGCQPRSDRPSDRARPAGHHGNAAIRISFVEHGRAPFVGLFRSRAASAIHALSRR
jgi:hypothetical protein